MDASIAEENDPGQRRRILESLTAPLRAWFGQAAANRHYACQAEALEAWAARIEQEEAVGLLLLKRHGAVSAEIFWLGIKPQHHRRGIGRALIATVERSLRREGIRFLFVMTLHPDDPYEPYRRTRAFYEAMGFELALDEARGPTGATSETLAYYLKLL